MMFIWCKTSCKLNWIFVLNFLSQCSFVPPCERDNQKNRDSVLWWEDYFTKEVNSQSFICFFNQQRRWGSRTRLQLSLFGGAIQINWKSKKVWSCHIIVTTEDEWPDFLTHFPLSNLLFLTFDPQEVTSDFTLIVFPLQLIIKVIFLSVP